MSANGSPHSSGRNISGRSSEHNISGRSSERSEIGLDRTQNELFELCDATKRRANYQAGSSHITIGNARTAECRRSKTENGSSD